MADFEVEITGIDEVLRKCAPAYFASQMQALTRGVAEEVKKVIAKFPGPVKRPFQFASRKSQRFYFWMRWEAGLGPYRRESDLFSYRLGASWATENRGEMDAVLGTRVPYAPWVVSKAHQQPGHAATGWVTDEKAVQQVQDSRVAERLLEDIVRKW